MDATIQRVMMMGASLDGPIKYPLHGKVRARPLRRWAAVSAPRSYPRRRCAGCEHSGPGWAHGGPVRAVGRRHRRRFRGVRGRARCWRRVPGVMHSLRVLPTLPSADTAIVAVYAARWWAQSIKAAVTSSSAPAIPTWAQRVLRANSWRASLSSNRAGALSFGVGALQKWHLV